MYATARKTEQIQDLVTEYSNDKVVPVALDLTDFDALSGLGEKYPDVNLVVNNAGYSAAMGALGDVEKAHMEVQVNYLAPMAIVKSFSGQLLLKSRNNAAVVNIGSIASFMNFAQGATYSASKAAMHSLTQAHRRDFPQALVVGIYPGPIDTDMSAGAAFDTASTDTVARAMIHALETGKEDVFPDNMATELFQAWKSDFKAVEKQLAGSL